MKLFECHWQASCVPRVSTNLAERSTLTINSRVVKTTCSVITPRASSQYERRMNTGPIRPNNAYPLQFRRQTYHAIYTSRKTRKNSEDPVPASMIENIL